MAYPGASLSSLLRLLRAYRYPGMACMLRAYPGASLSCRISGWRIAKLRCRISTRAWRHLRVAYRQVPLPYHPILAAPCPEAIWPRVRLMRDERCGAVDSIAPYLSSRIKLTSIWRRVRLMRDERCGAVESIASVSFITHEANVNLAQSPP